jgi:beta-glucosidase/6-phospho-beta-glucosidase/beta-galactosidase
MPTGELPLNQEGIDHYNDVVNTLLEHNVQVNSYDMIVSFA